MKPARFFLLFVALAAVSGMVDAVWQKRLDAQVAKVEQRCRSESDEAIGKFDKEKDAQSPWKLSPMVCDKTLVSSTQHEAVGIQKEVVDAHMARRDHFYPGFLVAGALLLIGSVPAVWYFLLRRISEVADAVRGRRN